MNRYVQQLFESIRNAADAHKREIGKILSDYQREKAAAADFKDEASRINAAAKKARDSITLARNAFSGSIQPDIENLRNELNTYLLTVPNDKATNALNLYGKIDNISEIEAAALLEKVNGNYIGLRLLDSITKKSGLRVKFPDVSEFENDLRILEALSGESYVCPDEYFNPLCEIFIGQPRPVLGADGKTVQSGFTWSAANLVATSSVFSAHIAAIPQMMERWQMSLKPSIIRTDLYPDDPAERAQAFVADEANITKARLEHDPDHAAAARAQAHAKRATEARKIVESYASKQ